VHYEASGRTERRMPISVVVCLAPPETTHNDGEERTFTDNISSRGARIFSRLLWNPGDKVQVTPLNQEAVRGEVVYCQKLPDARYSIGVKFQEPPVTWSTLSRYNGRAAHA
jgi:hypothetical protein